MFSGSIVCFELTKRDKDVLFYLLPDRDHSFYRSVFLFEHLRTALLPPHATSSPSHPTISKPSLSYLSVEAVVLRERESCLCVQPLLLVRLQHSSLGARRPEGPRNTRKKRKKKFAVVFNGSLHRTSALTKRFLLSFSLLKTSRVSSLKSSGKDETRAGVPTGSIGELPKASPRFALVLLFIQKGFPFIMEALL